MFLLGRVPFTDYFGECFPHEADISSLDIGNSYGQPNFYPYGGHHPIFEHYYEHLQIKSYWTS